MTETKRKPGRPPKARPAADMTPSEAENSRVEVARDREEEAHSPNRPPRQPMGTCLNLEFGDLVSNKNYYYRVISDKPGRVQQAKRAYYEHVKEDGVNVTRPGGKYTQYLMRLPMKYRLEDQELKDKARRDNLSKQQVLKEGEYLPDDRHHVLQKDDDYDPLA